ncbi:hypothetical protein K3217_18755 [bacterium BD-1]|uniref:Uncharacterized protein n=1 Tax=Arenimonas malthae CC-JY-1 TaxID=1384054 RepID=A0A091AYV5_9GAMM|nr:hypothetical protein [Arenimonas malthae]KFN45483.1 hypothetical protein N790_02415 [Arenimonas malthae CC-JY-1]MBY4597559.1 hypothetical protein [Ottowia caeni]
MRISDDLAFRLRNWFWYWQVRAISGLSDEGLDHKCFGETENQRRHFERIRASASSPDRVKVVGDLTLLDAVDGWDQVDDGEPGPYAEAKRAFRSRFWEFLATRDLEACEYSEFIQKYVKERDWIRVSADDSALFRTFLGEEEPAIEQGISTAYSAMLHKLVEEATPDTAAVLVALFREAMHRVDLDQAIAIKSALSTAVMVMCRLAKIDGPTGHIIWQITKDRVLANHWITEAHWREHTQTPAKRNRSTRERIKEFQQWVWWYVARPLSFHNTGYGLFPIVPGSERTTWIEQNRGVLEAIHDDVSHYRREHLLTRDASDPAIRRHAEELREKADELVAAFPAPSGSPARFYFSRPNLEMEHLPPAYVEAEASGACAD